MLKLTPRDEMAPFIVFPVPRKKQTPSGECFGVVYTTRNVGLHPTSGSTAADPGWEKK